MSEALYLPHLEWQALLVLYRQKDWVSSPLLSVGFKRTATALVKHEPPLAVWIGHPSDNRLHITDVGIALREGEEHLH